ncbi:MAG: hypothetical protein AAFR63_07675 [Cyanobacteria bacterium J06631_6]
MITGADETRALKPKKSCPALKNGRRSPKLVNIQKYKEYYLGKHGVPESESDRFIAMRLNNQRQQAVDNRQAIVKLSQAKKNFSQS